MGATSNKLAALKAALLLKQGGLLAHHTHTLAGVAANPRSATSIKRLCRFKQRQGPFLLLADSLKTAMQQVRFFSPALRKLIKKSWPGPVTIIIPARPGLPKQCYAGKSIAIRVDTSLQTRQLAKASGGLLLSSSLNRKGGKTSIPELKNRYRLHRHLNYHLSGQPGTGKASTIMRVWRNNFTTIRP